MSTLDNYLKNKRVELEYSRTFNLHARVRAHKYENERITVKVILDGSEEDPEKEYMSLKASVLRLQKKGESLEPLKKVVEAVQGLESVRKAFPQNLANLLVFEETKDAVIIKPRQFLGSDNFAKVASIVRELEGEYVSAGKNSHFRIPKGENSK